MAEDIDRLYELPLDEFTSARDELARDFRRDGDRDAAEEVKRLRKPSAAAWALNQVRRKERKRSDELLDVSRRMREGQESLLAGEGREQLEEAAADERRLVDDLAGRAEQELASAGSAPGAAVKDKLRATLHAVASDPEARESFEAGRLVRDHEASGLGPFVETTAPPARAPSGGRRKQPSGGRRKQSPPSKPGAAERKARRIEERLDRARSRHSELDQESTDARRRLKEARRDAQRAASELERAEAAEERARGRSEKAADEVDALEGELRELGAG